MRSLALAVILTACGSPGEHAPDGGPRSDAPPPDVAVDADLVVPPVGNIQMNDLSVLLPLATTADDFVAYLAASSPSAHGPLLPEALYDSDGGAFQIPYDQLRVVALRFDPCFAQTASTDPATCDNELRLVFQPLSFGSGATTAADAGVHVSYAISRAQLATAVNAIAAARAVTRTDDLGPLAANPIVASEGLRGAMAQQLASIITTYADGTRIERITSLVVPDTVVIGATPPPVTWDLHGFKVVDDVETPLAIPTLAGATDVLLEASTAPLETQFSQTSSSHDAITLLASADQATAAAAAARQAAYDAALRVEDPGDETPNTIDRASCHMAEPARRLVGEQVLGLSSAGDANAFAAAASIPAADLVTATTLVDADGILNLHAFSYRGASPMINQRVVNETAANLAYLQSL